MSSNNQTEMARLTGIKMALIQTTATQGWAYIRQISDNVVAKAIQDSLDAPDRESGEMLRLKAKALQKGFADLFNAIDVTKDFEAPHTDDDLFGQLAYEENE